MPDIQKPAPDAKNPEIPRHGRNRLLINSVFLTWLLALALLLGFSISSVGSVLELVFVVSACITYATLYVSPLFLLALLPRPVANVLVVSGGAALLIVLVGDYKLFSMYGFHINGFVINLVKTPGGLESLGADDRFFVTLGVFFVIAIAVFIAVAKYVPVYRTAPAAIRKKRIIFPLILASMIVQAVSYSYAFYTANSPVLVAGDKIALFQPVHANDTYADLGIAGKARDVARVPSLQGKLLYPLRPIELVPERKKPLNIVWLVAESWRWDMLDPRITPKTWEFAAENLNFTNHYSGGNGTRMGVFSMFTGLYGSYWFDFLNGKRSPVLIDTLIDMNYSMKAFTSAKFSYPEFDRTIFTRFRQDQLQSFDDGPGWQRDRKNIGDMLEFIDQQSGPFFTFMFLESPHAKYDFPPENAIEADYLPDFDYATANISKEIGRIKNRYINSCNHLDSQLDRVISHLRDKQLLDNTIVVITGDHGEEFMEKGYWGHNSSFVQEQIKVPLILHVPGVAPASTQQMTSHLDLPATILKLLGVQNPSAEYSFGSDLLSADYEREYAVIADWHGLNIVTHRVKMNLSPSASRTQQTLTSIEDQPIGDDDLLPVDKLALKDMLSNLARFSQSTTMVGSR